MTKRGDIVLIDFPFSSGPMSKIRPAVVIQNDQDNATMAKTIVAMITGNLKRRHHPAHLLVDPSTPDGASSGLYAVSLISCINLYTVDQVAIIKTIGSLSNTLQAELDDCLRRSIGLP